MKQMTRWVEVKNSQKEITNKHEGKPVIYLEKFSASGHLFFHIFFPWNQLDTRKCISHLWTHYERLHYEDKGCSNMDTAGINLPLVGLIIIKTQYHHTKENWKTNLSYCVLSKYPHLCSPIPVSFLGFKVIRMLNVIRITQLTDPESILPGWVNVHGHTGVFHGAPIFAVAIELNSHK